MSTSRGNSTRNRPQKYQNKTAFKNDLHDKSKKTKSINSMDISGVCARCKDIIEWKIKYKKYKPLTAPTKCVGCEQKTVKHAYHVLCGSCVRTKKVCAKCTQSFQVQKETLPEVESGQNIPDNLPALLKSLPERKRRTLLRYLDKQKDGGKNIPEDFLKNFQNVNLDDDDDSDLDFLSDEDVE